MKILYLLHVNFGYSLETGYITKANVPHFIRLGHDCPNYPARIQYRKNRLGNRENSTMKAARCQHEF